MAQAQVKKGYAQRKLMAEREQQVTEHVKQVTAWAKSLGADVLAPEDLARKFIVTFRDVTKSKGVNTVYGSKEHQSSGLNATLRAYYGEEAPSPVAITDYLCEVKGFHTRGIKGTDKTNGRGSVMIYLPEDSIGDSGQRTEGTLRKLGLL
jgi:hypothetical protein